MNESNLVSVYLQEYSKLKDEQAQRIGFRDNLLYVTLSLFGVIMALAVGERSTPYALLVLPWICLVLGWTYVNNDQKISAIGHYIHNHLGAQVHQVLHDQCSDLQYSIFGWEIENRRDQTRKRRKIEQLIVNEMAFICSGVTALIVFSRLMPQIDWQVRLFSAIELVLLLILGFEIWRHADLTKGC
ncbi:hypothetical protein Q2T42_08610 [Leptolyngbya boryana CZ1]|uniref:Integral membrane protein n=1 Tax=Leptolyngbya boryana CZ1 TaxID=3060204 RepID=A0AA96WZB2_LEPBY|nr:MULTISPECIES: hypothetical protein [Leptolyngbya]MBD1858907.1 hypothetical protein [Leptolyngbya sp. FACHB-1624]MBN8560632.1 hypothetical protein [Leptolyngbya sp. UWPOB_LEPTO1]WNZ47893.1 hypothetical protein Q2T42_08610 [Leptolyngbya boryana CZ1]